MANFSDLCDEGKQVFARIMRESDQVTEDVRKAAMKKAEEACDGSDSEQSNP